MSNSSPRSGPGKKYYQFTAIDDCTRLRVLRIYPRCNQKTAIQFLDYLPAKLPLLALQDVADVGGDSNVLSDGQREPRRRATGSPEGPDGPF